MPRLWAHSACCVNRRQAQGTSHVTPTAETRAVQKHVNALTSRTKPKAVSRRRKKQAGSKLSTDGCVNSARHLYLTKDTVCHTESQLDYLQGAPVVRAMIGGGPRMILVDTGSSLSLIQPGVCTSVVNSATVTPYGVTGDELR